jgi:hypothetical protein
VRPHIVRVRTGLRNPSFAKVLCKFVPFKNVSATSALNPGLIEWK